MHNFVERNIHTWLHGRVKERDRRVAKYTFNTSYSDYTLKLFERTLRYDARALRQLLPWREDFESVTPSPDAMITVCTSFSASFAQHSDALNLHHFPNIQDRAATVSTPIKRPPAYFTAAPTPMKPPGPHVTQYSSLDCTSNQVYTAPDGTLVRAFPAEELCCPHTHSSGSALRRPHQTRQEACD